MKLKFTKDVNNARVINKGLFRKGLIRGFIGALGICVSTYMLEKGAIERATAKTSDAILDTIEDVEVANTWDEDHGIR